MSGFTPRILRSDEITEETWFRLKVLKWDYYQKVLSGEEDDGVGRTFIKLRVIGVSDTMLEERCLVRGLFWELLRYSGAGRRPGWIVAGSDEPLTVERLGSFLRLPIIDVFEPLKRLIDTKRIQAWSAQPPSEYSSEEPLNADCDINATMGHSSGVGEISHIDRGDLSETAKISPRPLEIGSDRGDLPETAKISPRPLEIGSDRGDLSQTAQDSPRPLEIGSDRGDLSQTARNRALRVEERRVEENREEKRRNQEEKKERKEKEKKERKPPQSIGTCAKENEQKQGVSHPSKKPRTTESGLQNEGTPEMPVYSLHNRANKVVSLKEALQGVEKQVKRKMEARGIDLDSISPEKRPQSTQEG